MLRNRATLVALAAALALALVVNRAPRVVVGAVRAFETRIARSRRCAATYKAESASNAWLTSTARRAGSLVAMRRFIAASSADSIRIARATTPAT